MARATREQLPNGATQGNVEAGRVAVESKECCPEPSHVVFFFVSILLPLHPASRDHDILSIC